LVKQKRAKVLLAASPWSRLRTFIGMAQHPAAPPVAPRVVRAGPFGDAGSLCDGRHPHGLPQMRHWRDVRPRPASGIRRRPLPHLTTRARHCGDRGLVQIVRQGLPHSLSSQ
jgi:hypothetical protein